MAAPHTPSQSSTAASDSTTFALILRKREEPEKLGICEVHVHPRIKANVSTNPPTIISHISGCMILRINITKTMAPTMRKIFPFLPFKT